MIRCASQGSKSDGKWHAPGPMDCCGQAPLAMVPRLQRCGREKLNPDAASDHKRHNLDLLSRLNVAEAVPLGSERWRERCQPAVGNVDTHIREHESAS